MINNYTDDHDDYDDDDDDEYIYMCVYVYTLILNVNLVLVTTLCFLGPSAQPRKGAHGVPAHLWTASSRCLSVPRDWSAT